MTEKEAQLQVMISLAKRKNLWPSEIEKGLAYLIRRMQSDVKSSEA